MQIIHPILDPLLTDLGREQAAHLASALQIEAARGMPLPDLWFTSPLKRTGETCGIEWGWRFPGKAGEENHGDLGHAVPAVAIEVGPLARGWIPVTG